MVASLLANLLLGFPWEIFTLGSDKRKERRAQRLERRMRRAAGER